MDGIKRTHHAVFSIPPVVSVSVGGIDRDSVSAELLQLKKLVREYRKEYAENGNVSLEMGKRIDEAAKE